MMIVGRTTTTRIAIFRNIYFYTKEHKTYNKLIELYKITCDNYVR
jgi:hypothetical protein